jgi:hypothetical protein
MFIRVNCLSWGPPQERTTQSYLCCRGCSLELTSPQIAPQINASQSSSIRRISTLTFTFTFKSFSRRSYPERLTLTVQRLRESGLHGQIAEKKSLLKDTNKKKRLAWVKKHDQWTFDWWKSVLWSDESKFEIFGSNRVFVRRRVGERMISTCMVPTVKHGGGGVMVWWWFAGDTVCDLFRI